jgi:hypothetical protein
MCRLREENDQLDTSLQEQIGKMQAIHNQLQTLRLHKQEEDAWELAEIHFSTNPRTLRNAFRRFWNQINDRLRLRKIHRVFSKIYEISLQQL